MKRVMEMCQKIRLCGYTPSTTSGKEAIVVVKVLTGNTFQHISGMITVDAEDWYVRGIGGGIMARGDGLEDFLDALKTVDLSA